MVKNGFINTWRQSTESLFRNTVTSRHLRPKMMGKVRLLYKGPRTRKPHELSERLKAGNPQFAKGSVLDR